MTDVIGLTISQLAERGHYSRYRIRKAVSDGFLKVNKTCRPMIIIDGEMPVTKSEWARQLEQACVNGGVPNGNYGCDGELLRVTYSKVPSELRRSIDKIRSFAASF
jgi:hypothetical protein